MTIGVSFPELIQVGNHQQGQINYVIMEITVKLWGQHV